MSNFSLSRSSYKELLSDFANFFVKKTLPKVASRKLLVFLVATHALYKEFLGQEQWLIITMIYLGAQSYIDTISEKKNARSSDPETSQGG